MTKHRGCARARGHRSISAGAQMRPRNPQPVHTRLQPSPARSPGRGITLRGSPDLMHMVDAEAREHRKGGFRREREGGPDSGARKPSSELVRDSPGSYRRGLICAERHPRPREHGLRRAEPHPSPKHRVLRHARPHPHHSAYILIAAEPVVDPKLPRPAPCRAPSSRLGPTS